MAKKKGKQKSMRSPAPIRPLAEEAANEEVVKPLTVHPKVCRLCETKEGPFLNIFGGENNTAKKIEELMPFGVAENDELPHKICFRCSAKVEELHEFVQKCIKTQENLYHAMGKNFPTKIKKHRSLWEEQLFRSNITNDDICDAVIKKAMEGIKSASHLSIDDDKISESQQTTEKYLVKKSKASVAETKTKLSDQKCNEDDNTTKKKVSQGNENTNKNETASEDHPTSTLKICLDKCDEKLSSKTRSSRSNNNSPIVEGIPTKKIKKSLKPTNENLNKSVESATKTAKSANNTSNADKKKEDVPIKDTNDAVVIQQKTPEKSKENPFNIMDHVSMIKVNGVGVLFQCKLCNRNFLKKDVVLSHWCAKNGAAKDDFIKRAAPPEMPRIPTVKYINTKTDDLKKQLDNKNVQIKTLVQNTKEQMEGEIYQKTSNLTEHKPKPKIGPASKVKRTSSDSSSLPNATVASVEPTFKGNNSLVQCPVAPPLNCRYKLVPGPNNTFTLVEAHSTEHKEETVNKEHETYVKKRKFTDEDVHEAESSSKQRKVLRSENAFLDKIGTNSKSNPEVIELSDQTLTETVNQPYPVGLFQTVSRHSKNEEPPAPPAIVPFATTAQKKQSYTIVQTGNPSKLLISAIPQSQNVEIPKKKTKKVKPVQENKVAQEPFSVTLEDTTHSKESGFFTFVNVDPLLQPSYVLPTDTNIIQESQISNLKQMQKAQNSSKSEQYTCNMCDKVFTREQKLLVHIHSHYNKMDEEDQMRVDKPRKRGKKS